MFGRRDGRTALGRLLAALTLAVAVSAPALARAADLSVPEADHGVVAAELNGKPVRLRVDFDAPSAVVLNPAAAARLGFNRGVLKVQSIVGPVTLTGGITRRSLVIEGKRFGSWILWFERDYAPGVDGVISPTVLPFDTVTVQRRAQRPGDHARILPALVDPPGLGRRGLFTTVRIGEQAVLAQFSMTRERSMANAQAGVVLTHPADMESVSPPLLREIAFGVERPVQLIKFRKPRTFAGFSLDRIEVRGDGLGPGPGSAARTDGDVEEVVVTGKRKGALPPILTLGLDALEHCSSASYSRKALQIVLACEGE